MQFTFEYSGSDQIDSKPENHRKPIFNCNQKNVALHKNRSSSFFIVVPSKKLNIFSLKIMGTCPLPLKKSTFLTKCKKKLFQETHKILLVGIIDNRLIHISHNYNLIKSTTPPSYPGPFSALEKSRSKNLRVFLYALTKQLFSKKIFALDSWDMSREDLFLLLLSLAKGGRKKLEFYGHAY